MFPHVPPTDFHFLPSGECHFLPSCPRHTGYCGLRWALQLLGQRCPHQVEDLGAARPAHHGLLLQPQWQHLCICFQLWLVEGRRSWAGVCCSLQWLKTVGIHHIFLIWIPQGHEYYNPQKKNYIFLRNAAEELKPRNKKWWEGQPLSVNMGWGCPTSSMHLWLTVEPLKAPHDAWHVRMPAVRIDMI